MLSNRYVGVSAASLSEIKSGKVFVVLVALDFIYC